MIPKFWISWRGRAADKTAVLMLLNALHFYMVKKIHLFIILTSGIHCVSAVRGEGERCSGQSPHRSAFVPFSSSVFSSWPSLCRSLRSGDPSVQKNRGIGWWNSSWGDNELIIACRGKDVPCWEPVTALRAFLYNLQQKLVIIWYV